MHFIRTSSQLSSLEQSANKSNGRAICQRLKAAEHTRSKYEGTPQLSETSFLIFLRAQFIPFSFKTPRMKKSPRIFFAVFTLLVQTSLYSY